MKKFVVLLFLSLLLAACAGQPETEAAGVSPVQIQRLNTDYAVGQPRVSFALFDGPEPLTDVESVTVTAVHTDNENAEPNTPVTAVSYADYEIPYWVVYPTLSEPGIWGLTAIVQLENGESFTSDFALEAKAEADSVAIGEDAPASQNKTIHNQPDLQKLSSDSDPDPDLYQMTVAEALDTDKPSIVAFATPGLCQTKWCAPVLDSVTAVKNEVGEAANFIHIEVFNDFQDLTFVPEMAEWGLQTEPWVFVLDNNGRVSSILAGPVSPNELQAQLQPHLP